jgi:hypothetical protein
VHGGASAFTVALLKELAALVVPPTIPASMRKRSIASGAKLVRAE